MGYNDLQMVGYLTPPLTTVRQHTLELGRQAGDMTIELLARRDPENGVIGATLVTAGSSRRQAIDRQTL